MCTDFFLFFRKSAGVGGSCAKLMNFYSIISMSRNEDQNACRTRTNVYKIIIISNQCSLHIWCLEELLLFVIVFLNNVILISHFMANTEINCKQALQPKRER